VLDALIHPVIVALDETAPPPGAVPGEAWAVAGGATGDWAGSDGKLAFMTTGGWRFADPVAGMQAWCAGSRIVYRDGGWIAAPAYAAPSGGGVIDSEARTALSTIAQALAMSGIIVEE